MVNKKQPSLKDLPTYDLENLLRDENGRPIAKGGVACPFPWRLHECLEKVEAEGLEHIISWQSHGRSFTVYKPKQFAELIMPRFFGQTRYASFQRQLNIYGFSRFNQGKDKGAYYHLCFVRGHPSLVRDMKRSKIKGSKVRQSPASDDDEIDFHDPAWKGHNEASIPPALKIKKKAVSPLMSSATNISSFQAAPSLLGSNMFLADNMAAATSAPLMHPLLGNLPALVGSLPAMQTPQVDFGDANVSTVSDDSGSIGSLTNMDDSAGGVDSMMVSNGNNLSSNAVDIPFLQPTPLLESCHTNMRLVDASRNLYSL